MVLPEYMVTNKDFYVHIKSNVYRAGTDVGVSRSDHKRVPRNGV